MDQDLAIRQQEQPSSDPESRPESRAAPDPRLVLLDVLSLMLVSPFYRAWRIDALEQYILPPIMLGQCRLVRNKGRAIGFGAWGRFNADAEKAYVTQYRSLAMDDWNSGDRVWWTDLMAPNVPYRVVTDIVREHVPGDVAFYMKAAKDEGSSNVFRWDKPSWSAQLVGRAPARAEDWEECAKMLDGYREASNEHGA